MSKIRDSLNRLKGRIFNMRTLRDVLFIIFGFFLTILLPAINELVKPSTWADPKALQTLHSPVFWFGFIGIIALLIFGFRILRALDNKIEGKDLSTNRELKDAIKLLSTKLNKLDKLDKIDSMVDKLDKLIMTMEVRYGKQPRPTNKSG